MLKSLCNSMRFIALLCVTLQYDCTNKYTTKMIIPKSKLSKWKTLKEQGDIEAIANVCEMHRNTISNAFTKGRATPEVVSAIDAFYDERKKQLA